MNLNFNKIIGLLFPILVVSTLAFVFAKILYISLPKQGIEHIEPNNKNIKFNNYNYINSFGLNKIKKVNKPQVAKEYLIDQNIILQAIYLLGKNNGFAVIQEKASSKTQTLGKNEYFKEYKLISIDTNFVVFEKQNKHYKLYIAGANPKSVQNTNIIQNVQKPKPSIIDKGDNNFALKKDDLLSYTRDLKKVWRDIGIKSHKKDGKIVGFKIYKLKNNSVFSDLGLRVNDILIKANNISLNTYQNAFKIYKLTNKMDLMQLTILRANKEMEIIYEIE